MRSSFRRKHRHDEDDESAFVSITDLTVSFLFIVILLLAFFASQYSGSKTVPLVQHEKVINQRDEARSQRDAIAKELESTKSIAMRLQERIEELLAELAKLKVADPLEVYINASMLERRRILERLRDAVQIDFPDLEVYLSEESDALRFQGDGLFRSGAVSLRQDRRAFVENVAARLQEVLPCYTLHNGGNRPLGCSEGFALIEAVQIEGHTDADGADLTNLILSTARANETFRVMVGQEPGLVEHLNFRRQPVLSVAGYGEMRPVTTNETLAGKASNRRIDLRIIMYVPAHSKEIDAVRKALTDVSTTEPKQ